MKDTEFKKIQNVVLRELGEGAVSITSDIADELETTLRDIAAYHQWSWLENVSLTLSTDASQNYITIPAYLGSEITIHQDSSGREIRYMDPHEYARMLGVTVNTTDKPDWYTVRAGRIEFFMPLVAGSSVKVFGTIDSSQLDDNASPAINGIKDKIPAHFSNTIQWGILRKLDSDNARKAEWATFYFNEIRLKRNSDGVSKGRAVKSQQDRAILNSRSYLQG